MVKEESPAAPRPGPCNRRQVALKPGSNPRDKRRPTRSASHAVQGLLKCLGDRRLLLILRARLHHLDKGNQLLVSGGGGEGFADGFDRQAMDRRCDCAAQPNGRAKEIGSRTSEELIGGRPGDSASLLKRFSSGEASSVMTGGVRNSKNRQNELRIREPVTVSIDTRCSLRGSMGSAASRVSATANARARVTP